MTSSDWVETVPIALDVAKGLVGLASLVVSVLIVLHARKMRRLVNEIVREVADDQPFMTLPDDGQTITVYAKKSGVVLSIIRLTILAGICAAAGVWMWSDPKYQIGAVLTVLFDLFVGVFLVLSIARLISRAPLLIVNAEGITDNAAFIATGMGLIPWREIADLYIYEPESRFRIRSNRALAILADDDTIMRRQAFWKRALGALNPSMSGSVHIFQFLLPMTVEELQAQIEEYLRAHGHTLPSQVPAGADIRASAD